MRIRLRLAAAAAAAAALGTPGLAAASCLQSTPESRLAQAALVFDGVALDGPTATGTERFRVSRWLKGSGPDLVAVATGRVQRTDGSGVVTSVSIDAARGETWRIYALRGRGGSLETNVCAGSARIDAAVAALPVPSEGNRDVAVLVLASALALAAAVGVGVAVRRRSSLRETGSSSA